MPTRACLFPGVLWLVVASPVWAAEPSKEPAAKDSPPWHIVKVGQELNAARRQDHRGH